MEAGIREINEESWGASYTLKYNRLCTIVGNCQQNVHVRWYLISGPGCQKLICLIKW